MKTQSLKKIRGQIAILTGIVIVILIGAVGLAIDSGVGYIIKAKLNAAVDAAGIAAARAVVQGNTQAAQIANAQDAARKFFNANYPNGYLRSTPTLNNPTVTFDTGKITIDVSATARVPVNFMGLFGFNLLNVSSAAQTIRKDTDMAFVIDTTGSMYSMRSGVRRASKEFLDQFNVLVDRVSLIHFATGAVVDVPFKADQSRGFNITSMKNAIDSYDFEGLTNYGEGFWQARNQLNSITSGSRSSLRVIVFFSDGSPNTIASYYRLKSANNCPPPQPATIPAEWGGPGSLASGDGSSGSLSGLFRIDRDYSQMSGECWQGDGIDNITGGNADSESLRSDALPEYYNAHDFNDQEFRFAPNATTNPPGLRSVSNPLTNTNAYRNINRASRNLAEQMAYKARQEGIYVFTLGLGSLLRDHNGPDNEWGEDVLRCMANTSDAPARCRFPAQPVGLYCYAGTTDDLGPCFSKLASEILRLSK